KGLCEEILLDGLSGSEVSTYLVARFEGADLPEELLPLFLDRTEGNPFFLVTLVDHLLEHGLLIRCDERWAFPGGGRCAAPGRSPRFCRPGPAPPWSASRGKRPACSRRQASSGRSSRRMPWPGSHPRR